MVAVLAASVSQQAAPPALALAAAPGTYNAGDISVINDIIANNGLYWTPANPADGSYVPSDWVAAIWSQDATNRRIIQLNPWNGRLTGTLDVSGLSGLQTLHIGRCQLKALSELPPELTFLDCWDNQLTSLPELPSRLEWLNCSDNQLTSLPAIPQSLSYLNCSSNQLEALPALPSGLASINCNKNQLAALPPLPSSLDRLECFDNLLTSLPTLPSSLTYLCCDDNQLTALPDLPSGVSSLSCGYNRITELPMLPPGLRTLDCGGNQVSALPSLPPGLRHIYCSANQLTDLPTLPQSLRTLVCDDNQVAMPPELPYWLERLSCIGNQLTELPALPVGLKELNCGYNLLTALPELPTGLSELNCESNRLTSLPTLPSSIFQLYCQNNQLRELNIVDLHWPVFINAKHNRLTELKLSDSHSYYGIDISYNYMKDTSAITGKDVRWDIPAIERYYTFSPQYTVENPFSDVKDGDWYFSSVMYAIQNSLFSGTAPTAFGPGDPMTRAMFAVVLARLDKANLNPEALIRDPGFTDVAEGDWCYGAVSWAVGNNIVGGVGDGKFAPNATVTREQIAVMLMNYLSYIDRDLYGSAARVTFADEEKISDWAKDAVSSVQQARVIGGKPDRLFDPQGNATRAEVAVIFLRIGELLRP